MGTIVPGGIINEMCDIGKLEDQSDIECWTLKNQSDKVIEALNASLAEHEGIEELLTDEDLPLIEYYDLQDTVPKQVFDNDLEDTMPKQMYESDPHINIQKQVDEKYVDNHLTNDGSQSVSHTVSMGTMKRKKRRTSLPVLSGNNELYNQLNSKIGILEQSIPQMMESQKEWVKMQLESIKNTQDTLDKIVQSQKDWIAGQMSLWEKSHERMHHQWIKSMEPIQASQYQVAQMMELFKSTVNVSLEKEQAKDSQPLARKVSLHEYVEVETQTDNFAMRDTDLEQANSLHIKSPESITQSLTPSEKSSPQDEVPKPVGLDLDNVPIVKGKIRLLDNSRFQAFCADVKSLSEINQVAEKIRSSEEGKLCTHLMLAYRLSSTHGNITESCVDDGELGAGAKLLRVLQDNKLSDVVVLVARWYGGRHLHAKRFEIIREEAHKILSQAGKITQNTDRMKQAETTPKTGSTSNHSPRKTEHLLLHDSTGKKLWMNKLVNNNDRWYKMWCPSVSEATSTLDRWNGSALKTVTLMCGVRDAGALGEKSVSEEQLFSQVKAFTDKVQVQSPRARIILSSVLPNPDDKSNHYVNVVNNIFGMVAEGSGNIMVTKVNEVFSELNIREVMDKEGSHVKPRYFGTLAKLIKGAINDLSSTNLNTSKTNQVKSSNAGKVWPNESHAVSPPASSQTSPAANMNMMVPPSVSMPLMPVMGPTYSNAASVGPPSAPASATTPVWQAMLPQGYSTDNRPVYGQMLGSPPQGVYTGGIQHPQKYVPVNDYVGGHAQMWHMTNENCVRNVPYI